MRVLWTNDKFVNLKRNNVCFFIKPNLYCYPACDTGEGVKNFRCWYEISLGAGASPVLVLALWPGAGATLVPVFKIQLGVGAALVPVQQISSDAGVSSVLVFA